MNILTDIIDKRDKRPVFIALKTVSWHHMITIKHLPYLRRSPTFPRKNKESKIYAKSYIWQESSKLNNLRNIFSVNHSEPKKSMANMRKDDFIQAGLELGPAMKLAKEFGIHAMSFNSILFNFSIQFKIFNLKINYVNCVLNYIYHDITLGWVLSRIMTFQYLPSFIIRRDNSLYCDKYYKRYYRERTHHEEAETLFVSLKINHSET
ncbi:hypothetical protein RIR_jg29425.t1 [Rhizophagus irregularis DAOM 181602=DAOM 197198]|nr:hypothetical protein RIR_jg29425.t1 [Rhizophagus irregularis DAOM 181602=DAOM 197198]